MVYFEHCTICYWRADDGSEMTIRGRTQLIEYMRSKRKYWEPMEEPEDNDSLSQEYKEKIHVIYHKSIYLLTISILNNRRTVNCTLKYVYILVITFKRLIHYLLHKFA